MLLGDRHPEQPHLAHRRDERLRELVGVLQVGRDGHDVALDEPAHGRDQLGADLGIGRAHTGGTPCRRESCSRCRVAASANRRTSSSRRSAGSTTASTTSSAARWTRSTSASYSARRLGHERGALVGVLDLVDLVVEDRVDGRVGAHDRDLRAREREARVGVEGGPAHRVEAGAVRLAHDHRDLGDGGLGDRGDHLGAVADDAFALHLGADHEAGHVGEEQQRQVERVAAPHEACGLVGRVDEQDAAEVLRVAGDDADRPAVEAREAADQLLREQRLDLGERLGVDQRVDDLVHVVRATFLGRDDVGDRRRVGRGRDGVDDRGIVTPARREERQPAPGRRDRLGVVGDEVVAAAAHGGVHARAAHLLEADVLADHRLGHARRPQVHGRVALDHEHDVAERRDVRTAGRGRAEEAAHLRHAPRQAHLVGEDPPRAAPAREQLHLVGDAGAGRVDEVHDRHLESQRRLGEPHDLLDGAGAPRSRLHGRVVRHDAHRPAVDPADTGDHAVGGEILRERVREEAVLDERALVEQERQAVAHEQLVRRGQLLGLARAVTVASTRPLHLLVHRPRHREGRTLRCGRARACGWRCRAAPCRPCRRRVPRRRPSSRRTPSSAATSCRCAGSRSRSRCCRRRRSRGC